MGKLEPAAERLTQALNALEAGLVPLLKAQEMAMAAESRIAALESERERLIARIADLEEDAESLSQISEEVETRLDGAIAEIRSALGR